MLKILQARLQQYVNRELPDLVKAEEPEIKLPTSVGSSKKQDSSRKTSISALLTMPKPLPVFSSVQLLSCVQLFVTPWITACQSSLSITNSWSSPKLMCIKSVMPSSHLILCHPLLLLPPIPPSIRVFSSESTLRMRWPRCWSFSLSISPFDCVDHNKLWKILKEVGISVHLTCLLRYLHAGQEATVITGHRRTDWFHIGKSTSRLYIVTLLI